MPAPHRKCRLASRVLPLALAAAGCAGAPPSGAAPAGDSSPVGAVDAALLAGYVEPLEALDATSFAPVAGAAALGPRVATDLAAWWGRLFRPEASPLRFTDVDVSARPAGGGAPDLVRSALDMAVVRLEVLDSADATLVRIADPGVDVAEGAAAQVIVRRVLAAVPAWDLALPPRLAEGTWYSTAASTGLREVVSWRQRLDVRVSAGRLELFLQKRGEEPGVDRFAWFDPEVRARLAAAGTQ